MNATTPPQREKPDPNERREVASEELLRGDKMIIIRHAGEQYRLVVTRNNRLILQK